MSGGVWRRISAAAFAACRMAAGNPTARCILGGRRGMGFQGSKQVMGEGQGSLGGAP
jgi:hypothetical protein